MLKIIVATFLVFTVSSHKYQWGYTGLHAAHNWPGVCQTGVRQSPVDIYPTEISVMPKMHFGHYNHAGPVNITNNGHTVMIDGFSTWGRKQPYIRGGGLKYQYKLAQFHLHWSQHDRTGSEHTFAGRHYPAELHLVHYRSDLSLQDAMTHSDGIAVVGVFLRLSSDGSSLSVVSSVLDKVVKYRRRTMVRKFSTASALPAGKDGFYRYEGSLTTPGCNEAVIWTVLTEPISISRSQLKQLRKVQGPHGVPLSHNYRPVQPLNGRRILYSPGRG